MESVLEPGGQKQAPFEVYRESDMVTRTIRDMFTSDIDAIYIDEPEAFAQAQEFMQIVMPRYADRLKLHENAEPLFHHFKLEHEVSKLQEKKVPLPGGGSLIIEQTEALVAIDVNSGTFRVGDDAEETAYQTNLQAAKEIARQLRLRNLGGVVVNDFIDMKEERHRRNLEETFRKALRRDRSRTKILKTSAFGVIEMTRQRVQTSLKRTAYQECSHCRGTGLVKTPLSMSIDVMRMISSRLFERSPRQWTDGTPDIAAYLLNKKRREISKWEDEGNLSVTISSRVGCRRVPGVPRVRQQRPRGEHGDPQPPSGRRRSAAKSAAGVTTAWTVVGTIVAVVVGAMTAAVVVVAGDRGGRGSRGVEAAGRRPRPGRQRRRSPNVGQNGEPGRVRAGLATVSSWSGNASVRRVVVRSRPHVLSSSSSSSCLIVRTTCRLHDNWFVLISGFVPGRTYWLDLDHGSAR